MLAVPPDTMLATLEALNSAARLDPPSAVAFVVRHPLVIGLTRGEVAAQLEGLAEAARLAPEEARDMALERPGLLLVGAARGRRGGWVGEAWRDAGLLWRKCCRCAAPCAAGLLCLLHALQRAWRVRRARSLRARMPHPLPLALRHLTPPRPPSPLAPVRPGS